MSTDQNIKNRRLDKQLEEAGPLDWKKCLALFCDFLGQNSSITSSGKKDFLFKTDLFSIKDDKLEFDSNAEPKDCNRIAECYMSPDHLLEAELDERSHVYSLGCIIYECLTGQTPFTSTKQKGQFEGHIAFDPLNMSVHQKEIEVPDRLEELVKKCIAKSPEQRFQSLEELATALKELPDQIKADLQTKDEEERSKKEEVKSAKPLIISGSIMLLLTLVIIGTILTINSETFQSHIYQTRSKGKNLYVLSIEDSHYLGQMEFENNSSTPKQGVMPLSIIQKGTEKIIFATTKRKSVKEALLEAHRRGLSLQHVDLRGADLSGITLTNTNLKGAELSKANLSGANLSESNLNNANMSHADLSQAKLIKAQLAMSIFNSAKLIETDLSYSFAAKANFTKADLSRANLSNATVSGAILNDTVLAGADFNDTTTYLIDWKKTNMTEEQFYQTFQGKQEKKLLEKNKSPEASIPENK